MKASSVTSSSQVGFQVVLTQSRISGDYIVFTEIYEVRNATGMISLFLVELKTNKWNTSNKIEQNRTKSKD